VNDEIASFRTDLVEWLDAHEDELRPDFEGFGSLEVQYRQYQRVKRTLWDAGLGRHGWPEAVGGLGGPAIRRALVSEEVALRELADPNLWTMIEVLAPTVISHGSIDLVEEMVPPLLRGDELWCQGFSEPDAGSDLASLGCKANRVDGGWNVNGQKVWTSFAQLAERCVVLTRTGEPASAHRGITAMFVDMDSPGITLRPIETLHGRPEFAEVFYDDVFVPGERVLGEVNGGWAIAMDILPYERSTTFWHRGAQLHTICSNLVERVAARGHHDDATAKAIGEAYQAVFAFRSRSRDTQYRLAAGEQLGVETSIDKVLISTAEQLLAESARAVLPGVIEFDDDPAAEGLRMDFLYARAATIYGGTSEIQRNIIARRLLDMGPEA
jgi:alkylation response protein AidB-like acyl-CoA dehydrogenase